LQRDRADLKKVKIVQLLQSIKLVCKVQKLSRHADLNTLMIYDDNRQNIQGELSDLLSDLV